MTREAQNVIRDLKPADWALARHASCPTSHLPLASLSAIMPCSVIVDGAGSNGKGRAVSPILTAHTLDIISHSLAQTRRLGARLGARAEGGHIYCLEGDLGSGKTSFVQGIAEGLGVAGPVVSPTFVLVSVYRGVPGRPPLYHLDLYRISGPQEALDFGLEEYLYGEGVVAIEWAERIREVLPPEYLWISFRHLDATKRGLVMQPKGARYEALVAELQREIYGGKE